MRLFLDTEFNGFKGELLSVALCDEVGVSFYARAYDPLFYDPWVKENVIPHLAGEPEHSLPVIREALGRFLSRYTDPEIVCDWPSDPWYLFDLLLGENHTETLFRPMTVTVKSFKNAIYTSKVPHHALWDARALRDSSLRANAVVPEVEFVVSPSSDAETVDITPNQV